jgi:methylated-DNA-[protein]-cysteine S-methyltransferase
LQAIITRYTRATCGADSDQYVFPHYCALEAARTQGFSQENEKMDSRIFYTTLDSPVGALFLTSDGEAITELFMEKHKGGPKPIGDWRRDDGLFREAANQLRAYFAGELQKIPYGSTISYGELARRIGAPKASRAVGAANGSNPISIIIPCHRLIGSNGNLTGYGGGIERKKFLLEFEAETLAKRSGDCGLRIADCGFAVVERPAENNDTDRE